MVITIVIVLFDSVVAAVDDDCVVVVTVEGAPVVVNGDLTGVYVWGFHQAYGKDILYYSISFLAASTIHTGEAYFWALLFGVQMSIDKKQRQTMRH
jgi:hypothetical protein